MRNSSNEETQIVTKVIFNGTSNSEIRIDQIGHSICKRFGSLKKLVIEYGIESIEEKFLQQCENLEYFKLIHTNVENVPHLFDKNLKLVYLDLSYNKIKTLSDNIFINQQKLEVLYLFRNQIYFLFPQTFKVLKNLRYLSLAHNRIQSLEPLWFESLENLKFLHLRYNRISSLPKRVFESLKNSFTGPEGRLLRTSSRYPTLKPISRTSPS